MGFKRVAALMVASATVGVGLSSGSAAAAGPQEFGCFHQRGSLLFSVGYPGTEEFQSNKRDCLSIDKYITHVAPISQAQN